MLILENIMLAFTALRANKSRALLTMLGIIIGIAAVIAIMTVGDSLNNSVTSSMASMGVNNITVSIQQKSNEEEISASGMKFQSGTRDNIMEDEDYITDEMLASLKENYSENIKAFSLTESVGTGTAQDGSLYANVAVTGVNEGYLEDEDLTILSGRSFLERDQDEGKKVVLVSDKLCNNLFDGNYDAAVGSAVDVMLNNKYYTYTIVGVYEYEESALSFSTESDEDITTTMYLPLITAKNQTHSTVGYTSFSIISNSDTDTTEFVDIVENFFNSHYYRRNNNYEISAYSMESVVSTMTEMLSTISIAIAIIAGISLIVGGIGVMNIMLVSITERTREIGTRKALGATNGSIRLQFIMESIVICIIGGILGIILGLILGTAGANMLGYSATPSIGSIVFSVGFSIAIGVFFGYYPANKAAKLNPIEALRYE